jgi:hypothetical protein
MGYFVIGYFFALLWILYDSKNIDSGFMSTPVDYCAQTIAAIP